VPKKLDNNIDGRLTAIADNELLVLENVELRAPNIFLYAKNALTINKGAKIQSLKASSCNTRDYNEWIKTMFKCMDNDYDRATINEEYFLDYYNGIHKPEVQNISSMVPTIMYWWNIYIMTAGQLTIHGTHLYGPKIGFCGQDITLEDTHADTSWKGCPNDKGIGNMERETGSGCAGPGGAHGGDGGYGGLDRIERLGQDVMCRNTYP